jgi:heptosyltransferase-1
MDSVDLVVAMDSLPLHLAGTTKVKTFSVFGASLASKFKPAGKKHLTLQGHCPYGRVFEKRCPILRTCPTGACIRSLTGKAVFNAFKLQWDAS